MQFYEKYIETVTNNDNRTRNSVDAIMGRIDELMKDRPDGRLSGLVVGRVQSGKTRNYVGLALKAAEAGWNVIIILTSPIMALAEQTEKRVKRDFKKAKVFLGRRDKDGRIYGAHGEYKGGSFKRGSAKWSNGGGGLLSFFKRFFGR